MTQRLASATACTAAVLLGGAIVSMVVLPRSSAAQPTPALTWCKPGAKLNVLWKGGWYAASVKEVPDASGKCLIGYDGYGANWDERVGADRAAPAGQQRAFHSETTSGGPGPKAPEMLASAGGLPKLGKYHCVFFTNGYLQTRPGFTLKAGGAYSHDHGGGGKVEFKANESLLEFVGGPMDKQAAKVEKKLIRLYNADRTRLLVDCDIS